MFKVLPHKKVMLTWYDKVKHVPLTKAKRISYKGKDLMAIQHSDADCAILARFGFKPPPPIQFYYHWSGPYTPFRHQLVTAAHFSMNPRAFCFNGLGCVHPDTVILTERGPKRISDITAPTRVLSWNEKDQEFQLSVSSAAYPKGRASLYRVTTTQGEFVATAHHRIFCADGMYRQVSQLSNGMHISSCSHPWTTLGFFQRSLISSVANCFGRASNYQGDCELEAHQCDQQPHSGQGTCLASTPSLAGAQVFDKSCDLPCSEFHGTAHKDGWAELLQERTHHGRSRDHLTKSDFSHLFESHWEREEAPYEASQPEHTFQGSGTQHGLKAFERPRGTSEHHHKQTQGTVFLSDHFSYHEGLKYAQKPPLTGLVHGRVLSVEYQGEGVYFDMQVADTNNYVCESGIIHHNSGKTLSALWAADYMLQEGYTSRVVVMTPLSTMESVWADTLFSHFPHRSLAVAHGPKKHGALASKANFTIVNHHGIKAMEDDLGYLPKDTLWILDEAAVFRNSKTDLYKSLWNVCGPDKSQYLWTMTGAPMPNAPTDVWAQARLINPSLVPKFFGRFRDKVMTQVSQYKFVPKKGWEDTVFSMLKPSVRFSTDECVDLPPITFQTRDVDLSTEQKRVYADLVKQAKADVLEGKITALNEAVKVGKLLQACCGLVYTSEGQVANLNPKERLKELVSVIEQSGGKCIVFVPYKHILEYLESELGRKYIVKTVSGDTPMSWRSHIFHEFQTGPLQVLLAHPQCMAHGVNLTTGSTIVWWAPVNSFEIYEQANARIRRPGQVNHQNILHLSGKLGDEHSIENRVYKRLQNKERMQNILLEMLKV